MNRPRMDTSMLPYSEAMGPDNLDTRMRGCWDISPVSRETISSWAWQNARSNLWSKYRFWKSRLSIGDNERTIETGCGHGKFSLALGLSGAQVTLLDYNAAAVSAAVEVHRKIGLEPTAILARIDHRFGNEGDFGRPERFSESFAIDPVQVE